MSDENVSGSSVPQPTPQPGGAFDWLFESHQQSAPMAPLTDDIPAPVPAAPAFAMPDPAERPAPSSTFLDLLAPSAPEQPVEAPSPFAPPAAAVPVPPPVAAAPIFAEPVAAAPIFAPPVAGQQPAPPPAEQQAPVAPPLFAPAPPAEGPTPPPPAPQPVAQSAPVPRAEAAPAVGPTAFTLERHNVGPRSGNGPLDWIAFVLAFLAPPIGLLLGIAAVITDSRSKGYAAGIAKAAIGIGAVLTLLLGVALVVVAKIDNDQAAHAAIVASSRAWCTKLASTPTTLSSDTLGWPSPGATIPASITAMKSYQTEWDSLAKLAPAGIRTDTQKVADTAKSIVATVQSTQTLNDASNVAQMQNVVAASGIHSWVSNYCN